MNGSDLDSFSNFWIVVDENLHVLEVSEYFKKIISKNNPIFDSFDFIQPKINHNLDLLSQIQKKILHFKCKTNSIPFRGTFHQLSQSFVIISWPFFNNIKEISKYQLGSMLEHPACIMTDFLILKDVLSKQQEKIKKFEVEKIQTQYLEQVKINQHQSKLATIGEIASGVGHEISNPLTIVTLNNAIMLKKMSEGGLSQEEIKQRLEKQALVYERMARIVNGLKTFTRIDEETETVFCLQKEVNTTLGMVYEIFKNKEIEISQSFDSEDIFICVAKGLFHQTLMNFISNARDALKNSENKKIHLEIQKVNKDKVKFSVSDNGEGITEENMKKILKPFFTTKASGEGTGIGMTIVQNFVHKSNAELLVDSTPGVGTTFTILLNIHHPSTDSDPEKKSV